MCIQALRLSVFGFHSFRRSTHKVGHHDRYSEGRYAVGWLQLHEEEVKGPTVCHHYLGDGQCPRCVSVLTT